MEISQRNTKKEILEAYEKLLKKMQEQKQPGPTDIQKEKQTKQTVKEAEDMIPDKVMKNISELKIQLNQSLEQVGEKITEEYRKLVKVQEAITTEEQNLKDAYQVNREFESLSALIGAQNQQKESFEQEMLQQREQWQKEKKQIEQQLKEEKEQRDKERKREEEEYQYTNKQKRQKESDAYDQKKEQQERELAEKRQSFEKEIAEREQAVKEVEEELKELRQQVEKHPDILEKALNQKEKEVTSKLETQYKFEKELFKKESDGELRLRDQTITTLQSKIKDQDNQINQLYKKVENADKNVKDIVLKAIETSGRYPSHIQKEITTDRSDNRTSGNE